jgi:hypothetical protein
MEAQTGAFFGGMLGLALCAGGAWATADGPDHFAVLGVAAGGVLNLRAEPDAKARKLGEIPPGARCLRNLGCQGGLSYQEFSTLTAERRKQRERENPRWCRVEFRGLSGWVAARYLGEDSCPR